MSDSTEMLPATQSELARWVAENAARSGKSIYPAGGRTAWHVGDAARQDGIVLSTTGLTKLVDYPARDMTVTVEAGTRVADLSQTLGKERQRLAVDVPQARRATLGGALAANVSGPRRFGLGTLRDYVIGVSAVDACGRLFKAGGRVVKNVAGYDLCKLLIGSQGTLAVITQVTLKLRPLPEQSRLLWAAFDHLSSIEAALARLTTSAARPVALELLDPRAADTVMLESHLRLPSNRYVLCVGVEGAEHETQWQIASLENEIRAAAPHEISIVGPGDAEGLWGALTEFQISSDDPLSFRVNLPPTRTVEFVQLAVGAGCAVQAHAGNGIVHGHAPDSVTSAAAAQTLLAPLGAFAGRYSGNLVVTACEESWRPVLPLWGAPEPSWPLMRTLKRELDPRNLLNPHNLLPDG